MSLLEMFHMAKSGKPMSQGLDRQSSSLAETDVKLVLSYMSYCGILQRTVPRFFAHLVPMD